MEASEKADKLAVRFIMETNISGNPTEQRVIAKKCALICVDEILKSLPKTVSGWGFGNAQFTNPQIKFYEEVKEEISKLKQ